MNDRPDDKASDAPRLSVLIVNWNTRDFLLEALASIYSAPPAVSFEVVVVDNASGDGSAEAVARQFPQVRLVSNAHNAGYAAGNNQALRLAQGALLLLLNPDVILPAGALDQAVAFMEAKPRAGALGVRQVHPDGRLQRSVRGFPAPLAVLYEIVGLSRLLPQSRVFGAYRMTWFDYAHDAQVDQPMGTFLLLRREAYEQVGELDEAFPIFFNEVDWLLRCRRTGWEIWFTPSVEIVHYGGAGTGQVSAAMAWESRRSLLQFYRKHYGAARYLPMRGLIALLSWPFAWFQSRNRKPAARNKSAD